jgi:membrane protease YdiL (CAAX protease family)
VIFSTVIFYYLYYFFITSGFPEKYYSKITHSVQKEINLFLTKKFSGFLILGFFPGLIYYYFLNPDFGMFGFSVAHFKNNFFVILSLITIITFILFINQRINRNNNSLQINVSEWNFILFLINATGWIIYLIGYEFLFRGILLFECYNSFGFWPAIAINVAIYSAIHLTYGKAQTFGSLLFGGVASYLSLSCGTLLIPIIMHVSLSLVSDYFSIRFNENLSFIKQKSYNLLQK